ncbi:MAG: hypothetical protein ACLRWQ_02245 [Flavonifractor plautii]
MLDLGGNVTVIGARRTAPLAGGGEGPWDTGSYLCVLALTDVTLSTSGRLRALFRGGRGALPPYH